MESSQLPLIRRVPVRCLIALLGVCLVGLLWAPSASAADNALVSSNPADQSTVTSSPTSMVLMFSTPLGNANVVAIVCNSAAVQPGSPQVGADTLTLTVPLPTALPKGTCNVTWRVSQPDGSNGGSGAFSFKVASETAAATTTVTNPAAGSATVTTVPAGSGATGSGPKSSDTSSSNGPLGAFRLFSTMSLAILFGSFVLISVAWPEGVEYILTVRFLRMTYYVALVTTGLFVLILTSQVTGRSLGGSISPAALKDLANYGPGVAAILRLVGVAACGWVVMRPERIIDPSTQMPALIIPTIAVATLGFSRPIAEIGAIGAAAGLVHALAMAAWFGGLVLLARVVLAGPGDDDLVHAVRGFSRIATPAVAATVLSGVVLTWKIDGRALFSTGHGYVMLLKTVAVIAMLFVGVATRQFVRGRLARAESMPAPMATRLRRAVGTEALAGIVVLVLTAWLLALTPGNLEAGSSSTSAKDFGAPQLIRNTDLKVELRVSFTQVVGPNAVRVDVSQVPLAGFTGLTVEFTPPQDAGVSAVVLTVPMTCACVRTLPLESGLPLAAPGVWKITVKINGVEIGSRNVQVNAPATATATVAATG
jgi:copper transport protein